MAKTPKYPNPAFFRTKNNMDWKAQGENLKEVFDIAKDMLLATCLLYTSDAADE